MRVLRNRYLLICDILLILLAYVLGILIVHPLEFFSVRWIKSLSYLVLTGAMYCAAMYLSGNYRVLWTAVDPRKLLGLVKLLFLVGAANIGVGLLILGSKLSLRFAFLFNIEIPICILGLRLLMVMIDRDRNSRAAEGGKRTLVIGAGALGIILLRDIQSNRRLNNHVIGFVDDAQYKVGQLVYGKPVLGLCKDIPRICKEQRVEELIFAIYSIDAKRKTEIMNICSETGLRVRVLVGIEAALDGDKWKSIRDLEIEDLLERDPIHLENDLIAQDIKGKVVMVTGGGGSIGSELCRQIVPYQPAQLIIVDIYENTTYALQLELEEKYPDQKLDVLIASVRDVERLENIFAQYRPDLVFHAAAHKHVPLMEYSPCEAVKNNVFGTYNVANCAEKYGAERMVLISTDKAVNPTNAMGASKRLCEMVIEAFSKGGVTRFAAVRFGNVLGSNGSVVPRFRQQIAAGGPVTVTHREITRFFMTIPEAAQLVLQSMSYARGGEIFVLDMGKPVKIYDLAEKMIRLSGHAPHVDIPIEITGLRPGEKLYEELLMNEEGLDATRHKKIFVGKLSNITRAKLEYIMAELRGVSQADEMSVKRVLADAVETYHPRLTQEPDAHKCAV